MLKKFLPLLLLAPIVASCAGSKNMHFSKDESYGVYKVGKPYAISGVTYRPEKKPDYQETGVASWYGPKFHGKQTANGDIFDKHAITGAHRTLPMPSLVRVKNLNNGKDLVVLINDRGPFAKKRIIDLSEKAATLLGFKQAGTANVKVTYLKGQTEEMLARMGGGKAPREYAPLRLAKKEDPLKFAKIDEKTAAKTIPRRSPFVRPTVMPAPIDTASLSFAPKKTRPTPFPIARNGDYYIQAGSFSLPENAERSKQKLRAVAKVASVEQYNGSVTSHKVIVGPINDKNSAERALEDVKRLGFRDAMFVAVNHYN